MTETPKKLIIMETSKRKLSENDHEDNEVKRKPSGETNGMSDTKCSCEKIIEQQEEIGRLRHRIQTLEETSSTPSTISNGSLEAKLDRISELLEKQAKQISTPASNISVDLLHKKIDNVVRLLSNTLEAQTKMTKTLESLVKANEARAAKASAPPPQSLAATLNRLTTEKEKSQPSSPPEEVLKPEDVADLIERQKSDDGLKELRWGNNLMLVGDALWQTLLSVDDVMVMARKMERELNFKICCRESEFLDRLYDVNRDKILFAIPNRVNRIVVSVGTDDMNQDSSLVTLRQASLEEVKQRNRGPLQKKAEHLKKMVLKLLSMPKQVILVVPPVGMLKVEILRHWEEIVLEVFQDITTPTFKILNLPELIRSTKADFKSQEDHLTTWFCQLPSSKLSPYGTRRLFDALKRTVLSRNKRMLDSRSFVADPTCPRCLRNHASDTCKSLDRMCRRCGLVGHFDEVHNVTDLRLRQEIVQEIGVDIYKDVPVLGCEPESF